VNCIHWPERYLPGTTDNFVSNEDIVKGLSAADVWPILINASLWPAYYPQVSDVSVPGKKLGAGMKFSFSTFGFQLEAEVAEFVPPTPGQAARMSFRGQIEDDENGTIDLLHCWLLEDLPGDRVRILTQASMIGKIAADMARRRPNPMLNADQMWLDGLITSAKVVRAHAQ
jgi:hypothetical protein